MSEAKQFAEKHLGRAAQFCGLVDTAGTIAKAPGIKPKRPLVVSQGDYIEDNGCF